MEKNLGEFAYDTLMSAGIPDVFWTDLNSQCDVILYGGAVRDFLFHPNGVIRDFDFVFAGLQSGFLENTIKRFFRKEEYVRNRFGGLKLTKNGLSIDCWRLEDTYAFRHGMLKASVENLIQTPMLNIDQYAYYLNIDFNGQFFLPTKEGKKFLSEDEAGEIGNQYGIFKKLVLTDQFEKFFRPLRIRISSGKRDFVDEFYSDRTRIIYFSCFRRLQQKAQVFSLESNSNVRTRLTHSIEVSDVGRRLALRIADELIRSNKMDPQYQSSLIAIVENACLLHDIGNPPFGHFGEAAIKKWWNDNYNTYSV